MAEFLVATPDSTFWVRSGETGVRVRAVPMTLAHYDGRFHEVFVTDVDRSFDDAILTGERVYVRDLVSGDSTLVYDDTMVVKLAEHHARLHPESVPLDLDDDTPEDPDFTAIGETDILQVRGSYVLLEHRSAFEHVGGGQHDTVETAVNLRTGRGATPGELTRDATTALDSVLVQPTPRSWRRHGYTLLARSDEDGESVSLTLRDRSRRAWPLFTVSSRARVFWLDVPPLDSATRRALAHAFNDAAAYDETVKYVRRSSPVPYRPRAQRRSQRVS